MYLFLSVFIFKSNQASTSYLFTDLKLHQIFIKLMLVFNNITRFALLGYLAIQFTIFVIVWFLYVQKEYKCSCQRFSFTFPLAKSSACLININVFLILCFACKTPRKFLYLKFFNFKLLHYTFVFFLFFWSFLHSISHYVNNVKTFGQLHFQHWTLALGNLLIVTLLFLLIVSLPFFRKYHFTSFLVFHWSLVMSFIAILILHGSFCFFKLDNGKCPPSTSFIWILPPLLLLVWEIVYKFTKKSVLCESVIKVGPDTIQLNIPYATCGAGIFWICCPNINPFEWHPFASVNQKNNLTFFIKLRGDWTNKLYNMYSCPLHPGIPLRLDGPYHAIPKNLFQIIQIYESVIIAAGIGITTFANVFYQIVENNIQLNNLHLMFICKNMDDIIFLLPVLTKLDKLLHVHLFFTRQNTPTNLPFKNTKIYHHRPCFQTFFENVIIKHHFKVPTKNQIKVYFSGKSLIARSIQNHVKKHIHFEFVPTD